MSKVPPDLQAAVREGLALHQAGKLEEAVAIYRRVLARAPGHVGALNLLAAVRLQQRDLEEFVTGANGTLRERR